MSIAGNDWPELPYAAWRDTCETLHLWTQIIGKIRLALTPILGAIAFKQLYGRAVFRSFFGDEMYSPTLAPPLARIDAHYDFFNTPSARESAHAVMIAMRDTRAVVDNGEDHLGLGLLDAQIDDAVAR